MNRQKPKIRRVYDGSQRTPDVIYLPPFPPAPAGRPKCRECNRPLRPVWRTEYYQEPVLHEETGRYARPHFWDGEYAVGPNFCTNTCAIKYANRIADQARAALR